MAVLKFVLFLLVLTCSMVFSKELELGTIKNLKTIHQQVDASKSKKLLYFWASWCPDCRGKLRKELRELKVKHSDIEVLTVNLDRKEEKGRHFIKEEELPFTVLRDEEKSLRKQLAIFSVPAWAVIEKKGERYRVVKSSAGSDMDQIKASLGVKQ